VRLAKGTVKELTGLEGFEEGWALIDMDIDLADLADVADKGVDILGSWIEDDLMEVTKLSLFVGLDEADGWFKFDWFVEVNGMTMVELWLLLEADEGLVGSSCLRSHFERSWYPNNPS
jgi:hypothetical protein